MALQLSQLRDGALTHIDKLLGRQPQTWTDSLTSTAWRTYGTALSQAGFLFSLPMTVLSFLAIPFFGGTSTSINLLFFYLTWSALIWTHSPRTIEIYGTLAVRLITYLLPSLGFLGFDYFVPSVAASIKAGGRRQLPSRLGQSKLLNVTGWAVFNVLLGIALQAVLDLTLPMLGLPPALRVTMAVPLPWTMAKQLLFVLAARGVLHYVIHRFVLHAPRNSPYPGFRWLATRHRRWAHASPLVFSLSAAYDHPVCYLLNNWVPLYLPAMLWRLHVLTFLIFAALVSLENLFVYSGYSALPSAIMLPGMARRVESHYATYGKGNFGHWGVMDFVCRTGTGGEGEDGEDRDVLDDLRSEADKHNVRRRVSDAVDDAGDFMDAGKEKVRNRRRSRRSERESSSAVESEDEAPNRGKGKKGGDYEEEGEEDYVGTEDEKESRKKSNGSAGLVKRRTRRS